jgi:hypothetical protein
VYLATERKNKDEIQGSFTPFRMTSEGRKKTASTERRWRLQKENGCSCVGCSDCMRVLDSRWP